MAIKALISRCGFCLAGALPAFVFLLSPNTARAQAVIKVPKAHLAFVLPPGYQYKTGQAIAKMNPKIVFVCQGPKANGFITNANLVIQDAPTGVKADVPSAIQLGSDMKRTLSDYKEAGTGTLTVGGEKAAFHTCAFTVQKHSIRLKQLLIVRKGQMYIMSFGAIASAYDKQVGAFDKMVQSIKWQ